jgi:predicted transcriptional regulator of viral defense system
MAEFMSQINISQRARAETALHRGQLVRLRDLVAAGISTETMARLVREGAVVRPARGLYQLADTDVDARHTLAEASALVPRGVVCLISALQFHRLTMQMPSAVWMAIERTGWKPKFTYPPIRIVRFPKAMLAVGVEHHEIEGVDVRVTAPARTIVDCFRYRNKVGLDIALEGLRQGLRQREVTPDDLYRLAKPARAWTVMRPYVEAMVADDA